MFHRIVSVFFAAWVLLWTLSISPAASAVVGDDAPDFHDILHTYGDRLRALTSAEQAKTLFVAQLAAALALKDIAAVQSRSTERVPASGASAQHAAAPDPTALGVGLTADLVVWRWATAVKQAADTGDQVDLSALLEHLNRQGDWLIEEKTRSFIRSAENLISILRSLSGKDSAESDPPAHYAEYADYLDRAYPRLVESSDSWLMMGEREGVSAVQERLASFWHRADHTRSERDSDPRAQEAVMTTYFQLRLRPVFAARLIALAIRAEAEAEQRAHRAWRDLRHWQGRSREMRGLARLCGTWQWTVHNHKNHQDHKMTMIFPPADYVSPSPARPAQVTVLGDSVYLRWEFQGGYQEDSLLFTGEGQRLEGNFINSAGAWGSITGKRIGACGTSGPHAR